MEGELAVLATQVSPYVTAAVGAYGGAVLAKTKDEAATATVSLGRRLLQRVFGTRAETDVPVPVADLAAAPDDADRQAALRVAIRQALEANPTLAADLRALLAEAPHSVTITASGDRAIAAQSITGIAITGDDATITR
ncbi:MAG TPA: hypothetical protein VH478_07290 [Trebonia sp.]|nr:hypothetical protein [Trebonia sp.]